MLRTQGCQGGFCCPQRARQALRCLILTRRVNRLTPFDAQEGHWRQVARSLIKRRRGNSLTTESNMHGIIEDTITSGSTTLIDSPVRGRRRTQRRLKPVRLCDVAKAAGVSVATVSMVLSDNPRISAATQQRVRRIVERM